MAEAGTFEELSLKRDDGVEVVLLYFVGECPVEERQVFVVGLVVEKLEVLFLGHGVLLQG